jgi:diguanylate cyclase (GGDEF)-like protein/PAS domain S-box-containing protein
MITADAEPTMNLSQASGFATAPPPPRTPDTVPKPVLRRLLLPLAAMVVLLVAGAAALLLQLHQRQLGANLDHLVDLASDDLRVGLTEQAAGLAIAIQTIATDPRVRTALSTGDAERLRTDWTPVYETLRRDHKLTHFYFFDAHRRCLLRVHKPEKRGDLIDRFTAREAERTGRTASGIELGPLGTFTLRVVQPIFADGALIGYVELGKEIEDVLHSLHLHSGNEVAAVIRKEYLNRQVWEEGMRWLGREADWDRLPHGVVIYASQGRLPDAVAALIERDPTGRDRQDETHREIDLDGKPWRISTTPLQDVAGRAVGDLLVIRDISAEQHTFMGLLTQGGAGAAFLLLLLLGLILLLLRRTDTAIHAQQVSIQEKERSHHRQLREREERYRLLFEQSHDAMLTIQAPGWTITSGNPAACALFGASERGELGVLTLQEIAPERQPDGQPSTTAAKAAIARVLREGSCLFEWTHRRLDGTTFPATVLLNRMEMAGQVFVQATIRNITEQKAAEIALEQERKRLAGILTGTRAGTWEWHVQTGKTIINERWAEIIGYRLDELAPLSIDTWSTLTHPDDLQVRHTLLNRHFSGDLDYYECELRMRHKNGDWVWIQDRGKVATWTEDGRPRLMQGTHQDITALKEHQRRLEHIAHFDALTTLPNRVLLVDRLQQAMTQSQRRAQRLAVVYLDLDGFKIINDHHGHEAGDRLLITVAARMQQTLRQVDTLARLGGDEFVAVMVDLPNPEACVPLLTQLLEAMAEPMEIDGLAYRISASAGVTLYPQADAVDADQLLRQADQAMYQAKLAGKNRYHIFDPEEDRSIRGHHESLEHIRGALARQEFVLYYQPKVNLRTGTVIGTEALIRWQHPQRGLLTPEVFLPVIENHPLAIELGDWVIDHALTQLERWRADGLELPVSVNIGARQLQQADFVARLHAHLTAHPGLPPSCLQLELLETTALGDLSHVSQIIIDCRELGITCALDDFGTGYSSLTYLKRLPINLLKIDQSFVRDMLDDPEDLAIVESVLGLARAFHRQAIAEGVETPAHAELLLRLGCELAQGYGIARPMPDHEVAAWAAAWRADPRWSQMPMIGHDDLPLLYAGVEHRAWIGGIEKYFLGERETPPLLDHHQCRFGLWLDDAARKGLSGQPLLQAIDTIHRQMHGVAADVLALKASDTHRQALVKLMELQHLRDTLLERLGSIIAVPTIH